MGPVYALPGDPTPLSAFPECTEVIILQSGREQRLADYLKKTRCLQPWNSILGKWRTQSCPNPPSGPLLCGPCIPIMLALALVAAIFLLATAVLAERLFRRSLRSDPGVRGPSLVWRQGELWIEPVGTPHERSEDWYGATAPLLRSQVTEPHILGGTLEVGATAPPIPDSPVCPSAPFQSPESPASTFCVTNPWEEKPQTTGLVGWFEPQPAPEPLPPPFYGIGRPGSPEPDWGLQPRVTLEQISAFGEERTE